MPHDQGGTKFCPHSEGQLGTESSEGQATGVERGWSEADQGGNGAQETGSNKGYGRRREKKDRTKKR